MPVQTLFFSPGIDYSVYLFTYSAVLQTSYCLIFTVTFWFEHFFIQNNVVDKSLGRGPSSFFSFHFSGFSGGSGRRSVAYVFAFADNINVFPLKCARV